MRQDRTSKKVTRPEDCVLGFGIPTTREGFELSRRLGPSGCFARMFGSRSQYQEQVIEPANRLGAHIRRLGATVAHRLTLEGYSALFNNPTTQAVIIISHWGGDFIEFHDGLARVDAIVQAIPESFSGVIDLCVCHPEKLIPPLRVSHMKSSIYFLSIDAALQFWLYFYRDLFRLFRRGAHDYLGASTELADADLKRPQEA